MLCSCCWCVAVIGISATVGWRPFLGPKTRAMTDRKFEATPERLKRGTYVAEHLAACTDCHTPFETAPGGSENMLHKKGSGQIFPLPGFPGTLVAPNITPDPETGVGKWTDDELARAIREGVDREGQHAFPDDAVFPLPRNVRRRSGIGSRLSSIVAGDKKSVAGDSG